MGAGWGRWPYASVTVILEAQQEQFVNSLSQWCGNAVRFSSERDRELSRWGLPQGGHAGPFVDLHGPQLHSDTGLLSFLVTFASTPGSFLSSQAPRCHSSPALLYTGTEPSPAELLSKNRLALDVSVRWKAF